MEWIKVTDRLPEEGREVIVTTKYFDPKSGFVYESIGGVYYEDEEWHYCGTFCAEEDDTVLEEVTHWMPLPDPAED